MTLRYPLPMDWEHELDRLDALTDDEIGERLDEIDRMATLAGVATAYIEPFPPVPWWHHTAVMLLVPTIGVCAVGIAYAVFG